MPGSRSRIASSRRSPTTRIFGRPAPTSGAASWKRSPDRTPPIREVRINLHQIASGAINAVNPFIPVTVTPAAGGYTTSPSGKRTPIQSAPYTASAQVQALTTKDLHQLEALNIGGSSRKIYLNGFVSATVRVSQKGGDLVALPDGTNYLTTAVLEQWPDWVCVAVTLQN